MLFNKAFKAYIKQAKLIDNKILDKLYQKAEDEKVCLHNTIIESMQLSENNVYELLSSFLRIPFRFIQISEIDFDLIKLFPLDKLIELQAMPYERKGEVISIALANPLLIEEVKRLKSIVNCNLELFIITQSNVKKLHDYTTNKILQKTAMDESNKPVVESRKEEDLNFDAPIIKLCDSILFEAVTLQASDIHIEPYKDVVRCRYRIDGVLTEVSKIQLNIFQAVLARFKIMAGMNIAERRVPQDGKISFSINNEEYDFRVSTLPTIFGEKIVIRIFNVLLNGVSFSQLGLNEEQEDLVLQMITRPHGIILLTGPTGSGKSTSLYTFLRYLNTVNKNIVTVEDPVENQINGINQVQVNNKANMTFSSALRSILRQDPNIIMIGEIRDEETSLIATRAAITGHLVLSTIHTNDAVGVVSRLINMNIPRYLISDALLGAISQRLIRKLCDKCKEKVLTSPSEMKALDLKEPVYIYKPCGCKHCNHTGYLGRVAIFEILVNTSTIKQAILDEKSNGNTLEELATKEGKTSLIDEARKKVLDGTTSYMEYESLSEVVSSYKE